MADATGEHGRVLLGLMGQEVYTQAMELQKQMDKIETLFR